MTAKHSPAPWKNGRDANGDVVICQADYATGDEYNPEYQANRALFDAAPDMLRALKEAESALANCYDVTEWPASGESSQDRALAFVSQAIAKATTTNGEYHVPAEHI